MDTELGALPTLPVRARTVSGCVNSAFLDISQHFTGHLFRPWIPNSTRCQHFVSALGPFLADCIRWPMIRSCRRGPARTTHAMPPGDWSSRQSLRGAELRLELRRCLRCRPGLDELPGPPPEPALALDQPVPPLPPPAPAFVVLSCACRAAWLLAAGVSGPAVLSPVSGPRGLRVGGPPPRSPRSAALAVPVRPPPPAVSRGRPPSPRPALPLLPPPPPPPSPPLPPPPPPPPPRYRVWSRAILDAQCPVDSVVPSPSSRDAVKAVTGDHPKRSMIVD